eukprot:gene15701-17285_t
MAARTNDITPEDAKTYLARKDLFQIFESLLTALLYRRPEDPIQYIENCMHAAKSSRNLDWDSFIDISSSCDKTGEVETKLKEDVKDAYNAIFKTEPKIGEKDLP